MAASVQRILDSLDAAGTPQECCDGVGPALAELGYETLRYVCVDLPLDGEQLPLVIDNLGNGWRQGYLDGHGHRDDLILTRSIRSVLPVRWDVEQTTEGSSARETAVMQDLADAGMACGVTIPIHAPGGRFAAFSVAIQGPGENPQAVAAETEPMLQFIALRFHDAVERCREPATFSSVALTAREQECLHWAARGKTSWETAMILDVAEVTVNFHLKNVMKKLGVANRVHAVARAVAFGLIEP